MTDEPILTLEPFIDAVRGGVQSRGWALSGLQKTTSHQFEGRWEGDSTRSGYLFFHHPEGPDTASIDVFLDETSRGLTGNLALVLELRPLEELGDVQSALSRLGEIAAAALPQGVRHPLTLRARLRDATDRSGAAEVSVRFKVTIARGVIGNGSGAVSQLAEAATRAFDRLLELGPLEEFLLPEDGT